MHERSLEIEIETVEQRVYTKAREELIKENELACLNVEAAKAFRKNIWLADSAASTHFVNDETGLTNVRMIQSTVKIGNGKVLNAIKIGDLPVRCLSKDNKEQTFTLKNVKYIPELMVNLLSVPVALNNGFQIGNEGIHLYLTKGDFKLEFDRIFQTGKGFVCGTELIPTSESIAAAVMDVGTNIDISEAHAMLGHAGDNVIRRTASFYGWKLIGTKVVCEFCAIAKAKQASITKMLSERSGIPGERFFIDISSIKGESFGSSKFWLLVLDDNTDFGFSFFLKAKSDTAETVTRLLKHLKAKNNITTKFIRCDDAGENRSLDKACQEARLGIQFEFTAPGTPQRNGRVERKFATHYGRVRAMFNHAGLIGDVRIGVWTECANLSQDIDNITTSENQPVSSYRLFMQKDPKYARKLRTFGEIGIVSYYANKKLRGKLDDRGRPCMMVGYAKDHSDDVYRMLDLKTHGVIHSRDIIWLNQTYGNYLGLKSRNKILSRENEDLDINETVDQPAILEFTDEELQEANPVTQIETPSHEQEGSEEKMTQPTQVGNDDRTTGFAKQSRVQRELRNLEAYFNPTSTRLLTATNDPSSLNRALEQLDVDEGEDDEQNAQIENDSSNDTDEVANILINRNNEEFAMSTIVQKEPEVEFAEPEKFDQAWNHENMNQRIAWRDAIKKEFHDMEERGVFTKTTRGKIPPGQRCVKSKWVFKQKRNGISRARLTAKGFTQIPNFDYTEVFSPVVNDITYRIVLMASIIYRLSMVLIDVGTAFLHGPEGMEHKPNECLLLNKTIYGLKQSSRMWFKKITEILRNLGFTGGYCDPCLLTRKDKYGLIHIAIYVDDIFCCGTNEAIENLIQQLRKNDLTIKIDYDVSDYLSCEIVVSNDKRKIWLGQPHLIKNLRSKFGELVKGLTTYLTPGTPGQGIVRPTERDIKLNTYDHSMYRSGVGLLLFLVKHSRPDIANVTRELSKVLDGPTQAAYKELKRAIKFVLDTEQYGLKIEPRIPENSGEAWDLILFSDSDWAGDKDTRISVSGYVVFLLGVPISWKSKGQKSVTLSSSEAEFVALTEAAKEIKFIVQILQSMGIPVKLPVICRVDNVGAIFMAENINTTSRSKHVDLKLRWLNELVVDEKLLKIVFVKSEENVSDWFTKNVSSQIYLSHRREFMQEKPIETQDKKSICQ
jgi:hypothetical protein